MRIFPLETAAVGICRFRKGGRGWVNPVKSGKRVHSDVREELKNPDQVRFHHLYTL